MLTHLLDNLDERPLIEMFKQHDDHLQRVCERFSYDQLGLQEPPESEMEKYFELLVGDLDSEEEIFKSKFQRLKDILVKMNNYFVDEKISEETYVAGYRKFAESIPEQFIFALYNSELDKHYS